MQCITHTVRSLVVGGRKEAGGRRRGSVGRRHLGGERDTEEVLGRHRRGLLALRTADTGETTAISEPSEVPTIVEENWVEE